MDIILDNNYWADNITTLVMYVGLVFLFILCMQILGPQDGENWEESLDKTNGER